MNDQLSFENTWLPPQVATFESFTCTAYAWKCPAAQFGLQSFSFALPVATAPVAFQRDHLSFERKKPPSPQATTI